MVKQFPLENILILKELDLDTHSTHYEYDSMGNITKRQDKLQDTIESKSSYKYDQLGRLIEEVYPNGDIETFTYDTNGNILTHQIKNEDGNLTTNEKYSYSSIMKDQLVSIQNVLTGSMIKEYKYENSYKGNPTSIITEGVRENLTWEGRKLKQIGTRVHFDYNEDGIRIRKQGVNFVENYILDGSNMIGLHHSSEDESYEMYFNYDEQGEIVGLSCEGQEYFYIRDITGNITKIVDEDGRCVVQYNYDAWGNFKKTIYVDCTASHCNPFVYKGYFFDSETGWYYLKSRYYDPTIRRFISADNYEYLDSESLTGINLYSYCGNSPVLGYDPEGTWSWKKFWGVVAVVAIAAVAIAAVVTSAGAASAAVAPLVFMYFGISASTTYVATATVATIVCAGIAAFAIADTQEILTNGEKNYLGFLGEAYEPIKTGLYSIAYLFPMMGQYAQPGWGRQLSGKGDAPATSYPYAGYNKTSPNGVDRTIYDGHGHAIMRFDHSHFHNGMNPHVHIFKWWIHDGKWRWNGKTGDVYPLEKY